MFFSPCNEIYSILGYDLCLTATSQSIGKPLFFLATSLFLISPFLFFISDIAFKKWLKFSLIWFGLAVIFIMISPEYQGGWIGIGPEKESVSILMSGLLIIISLGFVLYQKLKAGR